VNSIHHQAVKELGRDIHVEAMSEPDGVVEAIRYQRAPFVMGLQWHPEFHRASGTSCSIARRCSTNSCARRAKPGSVSTTRKTSFPPAKAGTQVLEYPEFRLPSPQLHSHNLNENHSHIESS
jgi:GMP synthase-like glutamine amidotransferase